MQPLKKPTQLKRWGKKNKISNKKFSRLTGLSLKKMSKSKKLPKIVKLACEAIELKKKLKARLIKGDKKATKTSQSTGKNMSKTKKIDLTKSNGSLDKVSTQNINIKTDITSPTSEEKPETTK